MKTINEEQRARAVAQAAERLGLTDAASTRMLTELWDSAFEDGRLAALDEFQDRFCVCMK